MNRLVFQLAGAVGPDNQRHVEISLEEPSVFGADRRPFVCTAQEPEFLALKDAQLTADAIRIAGRRLYDAVVTHPELSQWLTTALQTQAPQRYPIYVEIATVGGDRGTALGDTLRAKRRIPWAGRALGRWTDRRWAGPGAADLAIYLPASYYRRALLPGSAGAR
jgi:hypothetical protein